MQPDAPGTETAAPAFTHSTSIALVDRRGQVRGYYDSTSPEVIQEILLEIGNLLRERP